MTSQLGQKSAQVLSIPEGNSMLPHDLQNNRFLVVVKKKAISYSVPRMFLRASAGHVLLGLV